MSRETVTQRAARIVHSVLEGTEKPVCIYVLAGADEPCEQCQRAIVELREVEEVRDEALEALQELVALHDAHDDAESFWVDVGHLIEEPHPDASGPVRDLLEREGWSP